MPTNTKRIFLLLFAGIGCWVVLTAWRPKIESYAINGKVKAIYGDVASAKIKYTQQADNTNFKNMMELDVLADGTFSGVINIRPHGMVYFYVTKEGYTTKQYKQVLQNPDGKNNLGTLEITSLHSVLDHNQRMNKEFAPKLDLYKDDCLTRYEYRANVNDILYFETLKSVNIDGDCTNKDWSPYRFTATINMGRGIGKPVYFGLSQNNTGEIVIADEPRTIQPVMKSATNTGSMLANEEDK